MVVLDGSIMNVALPTVQRVLHFDADSLQWVLNAFMIPFAGLLLLAGRLADLYGRRRFFLTGIVLFTAASLLGGLATDATTLIIARAGQGVGAAIIAPATLAVLSTTFTEPGERAKAFGLWGAAAGSGGAIGVLAGGVIVQWLSWRWVLLVNVPLGVLLFLMAAASVIESRDTRAARKLDFLGALSVTVGIAALVYGVAEGGRYGWGSGRIVAALAVGAVLLATFLVDQAVLADQPLMPLDIFRSRSVSGSNAVMFLAGAAMLSTFYFMTLLLQEVLHYNAIHTGLAYLPLALSTFVGAGVCSAIVAKTGARPVLALGTALGIVGLVWLSRADEHATFAAGLLGPTVLFGIGVGLVITGTANGATVDVPWERQGLASGLLNTNQSLGSAAGLAALVAVATSRTAHTAAGDPASLASGHALASGFQLAFVVAAVFMAVGFVISLVIPRPAAQPA
jgi:EmrB/QacA subfamily drug resistance transporter